MVDGGWGGQSIEKRREALNNNHIAKEEAAQMKRANGAQRRRRQKQRPLNLQVELRIGESEDPLPQAEARRMPRLERDAKYTIFTRSLLLLLR